MLKTLLLALFTIQSAIIDDSPNDQLRYESKTAGYTITLPRAWRATADKKIYTQDGRPILVDLWANEPDKHISLEIIVNYAVGEDQRISTQSDLKHISQFIEDYQVEESKQTTVDGIPATEHVITYLDSVEIAKVQYLIVTNRQIYEITFTMPKENLEQNKKEIEKVMNSLHFKKHEK